MGPARALDLGPDCVFLVSVRGCAARRSCRVSSSRASPGRSLPSTVPAWDTAPLGGASPEWERYQDDRDRNSLIPMALLA